MDKCPCGTGKAYEDCCSPYHQGARQAETAETLMRSRYSAFVKAEIPYIISTHHELTKDGMDENEITEWAKDSKWQGLEIVDTELGGETDETGIVEFKATYEVKGRKVVHHERSDFKKEAGNWYFYDGKVIQESVKRAHPKIGRNDPCHCGSGKKYKKCCYKEES